MDTTDQPIIKTTNVPYLFYPASSQDMSPHIGELAEALCKAQSVIKNASKDATNPFYGRKYADLTSVWDAARKPLTENGLSVVQTNEPTDSNEIIVVTTLLHKSGQWMRGRLKIKPSKDDPQGMGSAMTYARRYALAAMVGIAPEDDDGNEASSLPKAPERQVSTGVPKSNFAQESDANEESCKPVSRPKASNSEECISDSQWRRLYAIFKTSSDANKDFTEAKYKSYLSINYGIKDSKNILKKDYNAICSWVSDQKESILSTDEIIAGFND